jgi:ABC-type Na+ efflux pump permease subunit
LDVIAGAALAYSFLVTFVLSCASRNRRANRAGTPMLRLVGWCLMSGSFAMAGLLFALVAMRSALG